MESCEEKFEAQDVIDSRVRIIYNPVDGGFSFIHRDMTPPQVREVCARISMALRLKAQVPMYVPAGIQIEHYPNLPDENAVCIAFNPETAEIQVAISTISLFDACIACDNVVAYIDALVFAPHTITELAPVYGGLATKE